MTQFPQARYLSETMAARSAVLRTADTGVTHYAVPTPEGDYLVYTNEPVVSEAKVEEAVNGVWQNSPDAELRDMTPQQFHTATKALGLNDEESKEAWGQFAERQSYTFFSGAPWLGN